MDSGSGGLVTAGAALQRTRAFDRASHERLLATFAALQGEQHLPAHDTRALFSADPDLHVLLAEGLSGPLYEAADHATDALAQARAIQADLLNESRHH
jgi:hypothetical protein